MGQEQVKDRFIEFYNARRPEVAVLSDAELSETIDQLEALCLEAKANLRAAHDEKTERRAKISHSQRSWLVTDTNPDQTVSDAISAVKVRKERMSKGDKLLQMLKDAGLGDDYVKEAERKLKTVPDRVLNKASFNKVPDIIVEDEVNKALKIESAIAEAEAEAARISFNPFGPKVVDNSVPFNPFEEKK